MSNPLELQQTGGEDQEKPNYLGTGSCFSIVSFVAGGGENG